MAQARVLAVVGFKNCGKTTLVEKLVAELVRRGLRVCTVKHAHHAFEIDVPGKDSWRHRAAGASAVAVVSAHRWAVVHELRGAPEPTLPEVLASLPPSDWVLVEGYRGSDLDKIEVRDPALGHPVLAGVDPRVLAVAAAGEVTAPVPVFSRDDAIGITDFVLGCTLRP